MAVHQKCILLMPNSYDIIPVAVSVYLSKISQQLCACRVGMNPLMQYAGIILCMGSANERGRNCVMLSLMDSAYTLNIP